MTWTAAALPTATSKNISLLTQGTSRYCGDPVFTSGCDGWSRVDHDPKPGNGPGQASVGVGG